MYISVVDPDQGPTAGPPPKIAILGGGPAVGPWSQINFLGHSSLSLV